MTCKHWKPKGEPKGYINWHFWFFEFFKTHKYEFCIKCKQWYWKRASK